jgi:hypothetical protein
MFLQGVLSQYNWVAKLEWGKNSRRGMIPFLFSSYDGEVLAAVVTNERA